jgi:hypothetical protein
MFRICMSGNVNHVSYSILHENQFNFLTNWQSHLLISCIYRNQFVWWYSENPAPMLIFDSVKFSPEHCIRIVFPLRISTHLTLTDLTSLIRRKQKWYIWHSEDRALWYILIIKTNEMHYFLYLFDNILHIFRTVYLSEICRVLYQINLRNSAFCWFLL